MDDQPAMRRPFGEVAMAPDIVEAVEIGGVIAAAIGIVPEADRHGGKRLAADQFALAARQRRTVLVPDVDGEAEARPLDLALPDRLVRNAEHEAGDDVGAAGDRGEMDVALDGVIDEGEALRRQRRARRGDDLQRREIVRLAGLEAGLVDAVDELRRGAEHRHVLGRGIVEQDVAVRMEGRAVIEQQRRAGRKA